MSMTREEIIKSYEDAVVASGLAAAAGNEEAAKSYELFKAGLSALRAASRERIEKVWRGEWILDEDDGKYQCDNCKIKFPVNYNFCPYCGSAKTEKALQKVIGKLESLEEMKNG